MHRSLLLLLSAGALLTGCSSDEQRAETLASSYCERYSECRAEGFSKSWNNLDACKAKETDRWLNKLNSLDSETNLTCALDNKAVNACARALNDAECDSFSDKSWESSCDEVLLCTQGLTGDW